MLAPRILLHYHASRWATWKQRYALTELPQAWLVLSATFAAATLTGRQLRLASPHSRHRCQVPWDSLHESE